MLFIFFYLFYLFFYELFPQAVDVLTIIDNKYIFVVPVIKKIVSLTVCFRIHNK